MFGEFRGQIGDVVGVGHIAADVSEDVSVVEVVVIDGFLPELVASLVAGAAAVAIGGHGEVGSDDVAVGGDFGVGSVKSGVGVVGGFEEGGAAEGVDDAVIGFGGSA